MGIFCESLMKMKFDRKIRQWRFIIIWYRNATPKKVIGIVLSHWPIVMQLQIGAHLALVMNINYPPPDRQKMLKSNADKVIEVQRIYERILFSS